MVIIRNYNDSNYKDVKYNLKEANLYIPMWDTRKALSEKIKRNPGSIIVADEKGCAIGNLFLVEDGWGAFIFHLVVRSSYKQRGIGQKLVSRAEENLKRKGVKAVSLFIDEKSSEAQSFFRKQGYLPIQNFIGVYKLLK